MVNNLEIYDLPTCESCWKECEDQLFDGVNYVCVDCYERNETIKEKPMFKTIKVKKEMNFRELMEYIILHLKN